MKISIAIADTHALPEAFVVYRGFQTCIPKAAKLGFDGVELALKRAGEVDVNMLDRLLKDNNLEVSCISTGQVYADSGLTITHPDGSKRTEVNAILKELIDLASGFGRIVNLGRVRGSIGNTPRLETEALFVDSARELCSYAMGRGVTIVLEPVNRYEIDFINTVDDGVRLLQQIDMPNMKLMPDVFHMNIEDTSIGAELMKNIKNIEYIHFADSNRNAPGWGHINFDEIFEDLLKGGYNGWISVEILPKPDPDSAAKQAIDFLLPRVKAYNLLITQNAGEKAVDK
jgi:sugar phosphate isomerase/epimerase